MKQRERKLERCRWIAVIDYQLLTKFPSFSLQSFQLINTGSVRQIRNEVDIQSICGHHPFIVECIAYWQNRTQIYIRELIAVTVGNLQ